MKLLFAVVLTCFCAVGYSGEILRHRFSLVDCVLFLVLTTSCLICVGRLAWGKTEERFVCPV